MEKNTITETQLESVKEVLSNNRTDSTDNIDSTDVDTELLEGEMIVNENGLSSMIDPVDYSELDKLDEEADKLFEEAVNQRINSQFDLTDEEAIKFAEIINSIRNGKGYNFNNLPKSVKDIITERLNEEGIPLKDHYMYRNTIGKIFLEEMISNTEIETASIDLEEAMKELMPAPTELYSETNREYIEVKFVEVAEKIKEEDPVRAQRLLDMRKGFIDSYELTPMKELMKDSKIISNIRKCSKLWKRVDKEYKKVAGVCKFTLYPLNHLVECLQRFDVEKESAMRLIALFVYTYTKGIENYKDENEYNDIYRNAFANYFEMNIRNLSTSKNVVTDFSKLVKSNILDLSKELDEIINNRISELETERNKK